MGTCVCQRFVELHVIVKAWDECEEVVGSWDQAPLADVGGGCVYVGTCVCGCRKHCVQGTNCGSDLAMAMGLCALDMYAGGPFNGEGLRVCVRG